VRRHAATTATRRGPAHDLLLPGLPAEGLPSLRRARLGNHRCPTPPQRTVQHRPPRPEHSTRIDSLTRRVATTPRIRRSSIGTVSRATAPRFGGRLRTRDWGRDPETDAGPRRPAASWGVCATARDVLLPSGTAVVRTAGQLGVTCPFADQEPNYADQRQTDWR